MVLTNDDAITPEVVASFAAMINGTFQANGCPVPVTWFTLASGTDCGLARARFDAGDELATHTMSHRELNVNVTKEFVAPEIVGSRYWLADDCGVPLDSIRGFRSPYLTTNPLIREVLYENDFMYDSSVMFWDDAAGGSPSRPWPYTMDSGMAHGECTPGDEYQPCFPDERWPGVWQVPVWVLNYNGQEYSMDPGAPSAGNGDERPSDAVLRATFDAAYASNRAPVPFYVHESWFNGTRGAQGSAFIQYALSQPDTYFVTMRQLIDWMRDPVPKGATGAWLAARCGGRAEGVGTPPAPPAAATPVEPARPVSWFEASGLKPALLGRRLRLFF